MMSDKQMTIVGWVYLVEDELCAIILLYNYDNQHFRNLNPSYIHVTEKILYLLIFL